MLHLPISLVLLPGLYSAMLVFGSLMWPTYPLLCVAVTYRTGLSSLLPPLCTSVLILDFLLAKKWLIIEPKSPQSLKIIYHVLKFAVKYKAPLNRSALTYWEEDVPSRMDLGKSRYTVDHSLQSKLKM